MPGASASEPFHERLQDLSGTWGRGQMGETAAFHHQVVIESQAIAGTCDQGNYNQNMKNAVVIDTSHRTIRTGVAVLEEIIFVELGRHFQ